MVTTLLETCGHYFDRGSSKKRLDRFLIYFQRYILSKGPLPLDIEFDLQDLFANLRPNMTRYLTIDEVNAAMLELEEREQAASTDKASIEKHSDTEKPPRRSSSNAISANGQRTSLSTGENGEAHEEMGETDSDSGSGSVGPDGQNEELYEGNHDRGSESDDADEDDDGDGHASDEDGELRVRQKVVAVDPEELADFDQELKAVLQESMEQRKQELRGRPALNMTIPMNMLEGTSKDHHLGRGGGESGDEVLDEEGGERKDVQVKVLVKRGNKQQTKQMLIPRDCSLVQSTKQKEQAELEEKQDIKRLVLEYNDRDEEEVNGLGTQMLNWTLSAGSRASTRTNTWEGSGRSGGSRHRHYGHHHGGGGSYHGRRK